MPLPGGQGNPHYWQGRELEKTIRLGIIDSQPVHFSEFSGTHFIGSRPSMFSALCTAYVPTHETEIVEGQELGNPFHC